MVRRAFLLPLLLLLALTGCSFFTASLFPGYLAQAEKSYDLGSSIDVFLRSLGSADYRWYPQIFALTSDAGVDYGGVLIEIDSRPEKLLLLADPAGKVQQLSDPSFGQLRLRAADNRFVVGKYQFLPDALAIDAPTGVTGDSPGFSDGTKNFQLWTNSTYSMTFTRYDSAWGSEANGSGTVDTYGMLDLRGVHYDAAATAGGEVVLVFSDFSSNRVLVCFTPIAPYLAATPTLPTLTASYPYVQFTDVDASNVIYTRKGIVLADWDGNAALMDFSGKDTGKKLDLGQRGDARVAFDLEGYTFYVFSPEDQILYRGNTGW